MTYLFKMQVVWQSPKVRLFRWDPPTSMEQSDHSLDEQAPFVKDESFEGRDHAVTRLKAPGAVSGTKLPWLLLVVLSIFIIFSRTRALAQTQSLMTCFF